MKNIIDIKNYSTKAVDDAYNLAIDNAIDVIGSLDLMGGEEYRHAFIAFNLDKLRSEEYKQKHQYTVHKIARNLSK